MIIGMKLSKPKCWILNMGTELLLGTSTNCDRSVWGVPCREGPGGAGGSSSSVRVSRVCPEPREPCPGSIKHRAQPGRGGSSPVLITGAASPGVLAAVWSLTI